jgi:hypothetical protein
MRRSTAAKSGIEVLDIDLDSVTPWSDALKPFARSGQALLRAFNDQGRNEIGPIRWWALQRATGALHTLLGAEHGNETGDLADVLDVPESEVVLANAAYDIASVGCSTVAASTPEGPLHARNLDWEFPRGLLKKHLVVARMRNGRCGDYALVTWPGMFGALTGVAPGRFSITVNFVTHEKDSSKAGLAKRAVSGYWPVTWAVRHAFDQAKTYKKAVKMLRDELLLAPVLLTVVGTNNSERVVIECSCDDYELRESAKDEPLIVTNHYELDETHDWNVDLEDSDSCDRYEALDSLLEDEDATPASLLEALSNEDVLSEDTQYQVVMQPATGRLIVRVPKGRTLEITV